jgi:hypothetical protein
MVYAGREFVTRSVGLSTCLSVFSLVACLGFQQQFPVWWQHLRLGSDQVLLLFAVRLPRRSVR